MTSSEGYPISTKAELLQAIAIMDRDSSAEERQSARRKIIVIAITSGAWDIIPKNWNVDGTIRDERE